MPGRNHLVLLIGAAMFLCITPLQPCNAQQSKPQQPNVQQSQAKPQLQPEIPDVYKLNMLIRNTIIALNQANMTGNYTVLRDLAAPGFQRANNAAKLAQIFANLRERNLDLSPVFFMNPILVREPSIDAMGLLHMTGFFRSQPEQVNFDMVFQFFDNQWRLFGIAVNVAPPAAQVSKAAPAAPDAKETKEAKDQKDQKNKSASTAGRGRLGSTAPNTVKKAEQTKQLPDQVAPAAQKLPDTSPPAGDDKSNSNETAAAHFGWQSNPVRIDLSNGDAQ